MCVSVSESLSLVCNDWSVLFRAVDNSARLVCRFCFNSEMFEVERQVPSSLTIYPVEMLGLFWQEILNTKETEMTPFSAAATLELNVFNCASH